MLKDPGVESFFYEKSNPNPDFYGLRSWSGTFIKNSIFPGQAKPPILHGNLEKVAHVGSKLEYLIFDPLKAFV